MKRLLFILPIILLSTAAQAQLKALIIDGQNNHAVWPKSTIMMKQYLEETGLFEVDIHEQNIHGKQKERRFTSLLQVLEKRKI